MARRSLRPHLNQIRTWVRQGRTDAWIAHQLEVTTTQIAAFKRENDLAPEGDAPEGAAAVDFDDEIDLRAARAEEELEEDEDEAEAEAETDEEDKPKRRRGRRGGRARRTTPKLPPSTFEGTFDHGEEGYGLWLDPEVADSPVYAEHWAGHRPVEVTIEEDQIVIRRAGEDVGDDED